MDPEIIRMPLFPLGAVLVPGLLLPLNVFEQRYRQLVRDLLAAPERDHRFGVVAIRRGREVGAQSVESLYQVGTVAILSQVDERPDGRFELLTVGGDRFRLVSVDRDRPYLRADVELLGDPLGDPGGARALVGAVQGAYRAYLQARGAAGDTGVEVPQLPDEPRLLSWMVAATVVVDLPVRQALLEEPDTARRLSRELQLLRRETGLIRAVAAAPAPDLARLPQSPN